MNDRELQEKARALIGREVHYCASMLVHTLLQSPEEATKIGASEDDLLTLSTRAADLDDYRDALPAGVQLRADGDSFKWKDGHAMWSPPFDTELEAFRDAFDALQVEEPDGREIYEHWIVSDWLAEKLEAKGESVVRDFLGFTIWGRPTTGQAIYIDPVIEDIVRDLYGDQPVPVPAAPRYAANVVHVGGVYRDGDAIAFCRGDDIDARAEAERIAAALNRAEG